MVHCKFIQNVLRAALPGCLSDLLLILGIEAFVFAFELPIGTLTTLTTLLLLAVGMAVLWDVCKPFTVAHGVLWGGMLILAGAAIALLGGFLGLERLDMRGMLILIAFLLLVVQTLHSMERGLTVRDLQSYFGFEEPRAIYKWQKGESLPTVDNLYALGTLFEVPMDQILVPVIKLHIVSEQQAESCCSHHFLPGYFGYGKRPMQLPPFAPSALPAA